MFLDSATLHDLEVFSTSAACGPTLVSLVDRTRTRAGRKHGCIRCWLPRPSTIAQPWTVLTLTARNGTSVRIGNSLTAGQASSGSSWAFGVRDGIDSTCGRLAMAGPASWPCSMPQPIWASNCPSPMPRCCKILVRPSRRTLTLRTRRNWARQSTSAQLAFDQLARGCAKPMLTAVLDCVGTVEAMWSLAVSTVDHGWSYPRPASRLSVAGLVHPFLDRQSVPNDLHLDDRVRVCFVTGPNMAGKSTFLKSIAVAMLLAHAGCGVPATSMEFPIAGTVFSSVQIADNLSAGESFYLAEVRRIRSLALALHDHGSAVAVVDEPFRGTNVHDAAEATVAVITRLAAHPAALVFVASHLAEVVPAILDDPRICLFHFAADVTGERPRFDYHLRQGMSTQRLGMTLLRQEQVLALLERSAGSSSASHVPSATPLAPSAAGAHQGAGG